MWHWLTTKCKYKLIFKALNQITLQAYTKTHCIFPTYTLAHYLTSRFNPSFHSIQVWHLNTSTTIPARRVIYNIFYKGSAYLKVSVGSCNNPIRTHEGENAKISRAKPCKHRKLWINNDNLNPGSPRE